MHTYTHDRGNGRDVTEETSAEGAEEEEKSEGGRDNEGGGVRCASRRRRWRRWNCRYGGRVRGPVRRREDQGLPIADEIRSLSFSFVPSRSRRSGPDVGIAKHCRVMSVITPTRGELVGQEGRYRRPSWFHDIAGPSSLRRRRWPQLAPAGRRFSWIACRPVVPLTVN